MVHGREEEEKRRKQSLPRVQTDLPTGGGGGQQKPCPPGFKRDSKTGKCVKIEKETRVFRTEEGRLSGITLPDGRTFFGLSPDEVREIAERERGRLKTPEGAVEIGAEKRTEIAREERLEAVKTELGTRPLEEQLQRDILEPPSLRPDTLIEKRVEQVEANRAFFGKLFKGEATKEEIIEQAKNFATAGAIVGGVAVGLTFAAPAVAVFAARSAIFKVVTGTGGSVPALRTAIEGLALFAFGGQVLDFRGKEMEVYRGQIQKVIEDGERIEAANKNGFPTTDTLQLLTTISEEVDFAEDRIKELGIKNVEYRISKEYLLDQSKVRSSRIALLRRLEAVTNLAATGQIVIDPQALMLDVAQFK